MGVMLCPDYYLHKAIKNHYLCVLFCKVVVSYAYPSHTFTQFRSLKIHNLCEVRVPNTVEAYLLHCRFITLKAKSTLLGLYRVMMVLTRDKVRSSCQI